MTKFMQKSFSVQMGGDESYRNNFDAIFAKKPETYEPECKICESLGQSHAEALNQVAGQIYVSDGNGQFDWVLPSKKQTLAEQVTEFHKLYGQPIATTPGHIDPNRMRLRLKLIAEEFSELIEATLADRPMPYRDPLCVALDNMIDDADVSVDIVETADALGDLMYVIQGMALEMGIDLEAVVAEIHASNLTKLGPNGEVLKNAVGKVIKSTNYVRPDIRKVLGL